MENNNFIFSILNPKSHVLNIEKYPNFLSTSLEIIKNKDEKEVTLTDLGFPKDLPLSEKTEYDTDLLNSYNQKTNYDTPFGGADSANQFYLTTLLITRSREESLAKFLLKIESCCVTKAEVTARLKASELLGLEAEQALELIDELKVLIDTSDENSMEGAYRFFKLSHRPLYMALGNMAKLRWEYEQDGNNRQKMYEQAVKLSKDRVKKDILSGISLLEIYEKTGVTKKRIKETVNTLPYKEMPEGSEERFRIEKTLFGIKNCRYLRNVSYSDFVFDFAVYREKDFLFLIDYDAEYCFKYFNPNREIQEQREAKEKYCRASNIPLLRIDSMEFEEERWDVFYVTTEIRNAFKNPETIEEHNTKREVAAISYYIEEREYVEDLEYSDKHFCGNYEDSLSATISGCYSCGAVFTPDKIKKWDDNYPFCPRCEKQTIIFDSHGFSITEKLMRELVKKYWGNTEKADLMTGVSVDEMKPFKYIDKITLLYQDNDSHFPTTEQLVIDGKNEKITYIREWMRYQNFKNKTTNEYFAPSQVSSFLYEYAFIFRLFDNETEQNTDPCSPTISITVYYVDKTEEHFVRTYNRNNLPLPWAKFMSGLRTCILSMDDGLFGALFQNSLYNQGVREGEYIFLSVIFDSFGGNKSYYYLTDDDSICVDDYVRVPVGDSNTIKNAYVDKKEYFKASDAPMPIEKVKYIIPKQSGAGEETDEAEKTEKTDIDNAEQKHWICPIREMEIERWECIGICSCIDDGTEISDLPEKYNSQTECEVICITCKYRKQI